MHGDGWWSDVKCDEEQDRPEVDSVRANQP